MGPPRVGLLACERVLHCGVKGRVRAAQRGGWGSRVVVIYPRRAARPAQRAPEVISSPLGVDLDSTNRHGQLACVARSTTASTPICRHLWCPIHSSIACGS